MTRKRFGHCLKQSPDPRLRTWIIHRLSPMGASPETIVKRLNEEPNVSIRRALILILGELAEYRMLRRSTERRCRKHYSGCTGLILTLASTPRRSGSCGVGGRLPSSSKSTTNC